VASFKITIDGKTAHSASPHAGVDALLPAANILIALQTIVARNVDPLKSGVISFGSFQGGQPGSTFVGSSEIRGLVRWFEPEVRETMQRRIIDIAEGIASSYGANATVVFKGLYPAVVNHPAETALPVEVARAVTGVDAVDPDHPQVMGSEDFVFMLEQRPGNIALLGNDSTAGLQDPAYDFNDAAIPTVSLTGRDWSR
jgi:hippurate hydrolase